VTQENEKGKLTAKNFKISNTKTGVTASEVDVDLRDFVISKPEGDAVHLEGGGKVNLERFVIDMGGGHGIYYDGSSPQTKKNLLVDEIQKYVDQSLTEFKEEFKADLENYRKSSEPAKKDGFIKSLVRRLIERGSEAFVQTLAGRYGDLVPIGGN
jgi:hypothetical protein